MFRNGFCIRGRQEQRGLGPSYFKSVANPGVMIPTVPCT